MLATLTETSQQQAYNCAFHSIRRLWNGSAWETSYYCVEEFDGVGITHEQYQRLQALGEPFVTATGAEFFAYGVGIVLASWAVSFAVGLVLRTIRMAG